jgi:hypothetical protein
VKCPSCGSPDPYAHQAVQSEGEVAFICGDFFHNTKTTTPVYDYAANLGLATTRQLLMEIKVRGETEQLYREQGDALAIGAANLLDSLPGSMLDYSTVQGRFIL